MLRRIQLNTLFKPSIQAFQLLQFDIRYGKEYEGIFEIRFTFAVFSISLFIQKDKTEFILKSALG